MKKTMTIAALAALCLGSTAMADTVVITSQSSVSSPNGNIISSKDFGFVGPQTITFTVAGKTCNLKGSARGSVPTGCNYAITVAPNGSISGTLTAGNSVCTQSGEIAASCKQVSPSKDLGCYVDSQDRVLTGTIPNWVPPQNTVDLCIESCRMTGAKYAGVENAGDCFCGTALNLTGHAKAPDSECGKPCLGNSAQLCGGEWRIRLYEIGR